jgi:Iap family predicted aminopeptidase
MIRSAVLLAVFASLAVAADDSVTAAKYRDSANKLIDAALASNTGLNRLEYLCYRIGSRLSGSQALDEAIAWSMPMMESSGLDNVRRIPVTVPKWVRGAESAELLEPVGKPIFMLGLGGSIATPKDGITADIVAVSSFDELEKLGRARVAGHIVVFNAPYVSYDQTVVYRTSGASRAARLGAVAVLVRSITPRSLRDPHTGALNYSATDVQIPAAAISVEDAIYLHRLVQTGGRARVHLTMEAHSEGDAESADVMGEITGRELPNEVVVLGGHLDSWDVGQGAHDDGGGAMAALEALALMKKLGLQPRRTIRVVLWTNEENGGKGGVAYREWANAQKEKHVAAIEMDGGAESPVGFDLAVGPRPARGSRAPALSAATSPTFARAVAIGELLKRINAGKIVPGEGEADIAPLMNDGVPGFGLRTVMTHYFDYHHSQADTFDKIVPAEFKRCAAAMAVMGYVLADWP